MKTFVESDLNSNPKGGNKEDDDEDQHQNGHHQQRPECGVQ